MAPTPGRESSVREIELSLERSKAELVSPVAIADEGFDRGRIADVEWHAATVVSIVGRPYKGEVCDLSVDEDETYVAGGVVVHNCRSVLTPLDPEEAHGEGITKGRPDTGGATPDEGFGRPPSKSNDRPNLDQFAPELRSILEDRLDE